jgi:hypothetical protein
MSRIAPLTPEQVGPDTPLLLSVAAEIAFPDGTMTKSGLRREMRRGRLVVERIANRHYTTLRDIQQMRALCRDDQKARDSTRVSEKDASPSTSFATAEKKSAQAAALMIGEELKGSSKHISRLSTDRHGAAVIPLK